MVTDRPSEPPADTDSRGRPPLVPEMFAFLGERWNYQIVREAFFGVRRFGELQRALGISPNVLTSRLNALVEVGLLQRVRYRSDKSWFEYRLTDEAIALIPAWIAIGEWTSRHMGVSSDETRQLRHEACGQVTTPVLVCAACGEHVAAHDLVPALELVRDGT